MKRLTFTFAVFAVLAATEVTANPAIGYSIAPRSSVQVGVAKPAPEKEKTAPQQSLPLMAAPQLLKQQGTHGSFNSATPVQRHRGPVGSLTVTVDIQSRPAF